MKKTIVAALAAMTMTTGLSASEKEEGVTIYTKCAGCHGVVGEKKALGQSLAIGGQSKEDLIAKLKGYKAGTIDVAELGVIMTDQVDNMDDASIEAVATYISTLGQMDKSESIQTPKQKFTKAWTDSLDADTKMMEYMVQGNNAYLKVALKEKMIKHRILKKECARYHASETCDEIIKSSRYSYIMAKGHLNRSTQVEETIHLLFGY